MTRMGLTRTEFVRAGLVTSAALALPGLGGCGDDGSAENDDGGGTGGCSSSIGSNHGHTLSVPRADVDAGTAKTYDITGGASHPHSVTLSSADFATLQGGSTVFVTSTSDDGHSHPVEVNC